MNNIFSKNQAKFEQKHAEQIEKDNGQPNQNENTKIIPKQNQIDLLERLSDKISVNEEAIELLEKLKAELF